MICKKCSKPFKMWVKVNGKIRNLAQRSYCLKCSPFGSHNTSKLHIRSRPSVNKHKTPYAQWDERDKQLARESCYRRRRKQRDKAIEYAGGCCQVHDCGYSKYSGCLAFHHRNPKKKLFSLDITAFAKNWKVLKKEIDKCILLCLNCHGEVHADITAI